MADYIKFLPVDNGDSILIRAGTETVMTDLHYRTSSDEHYDIKPDIQKACESERLKYFIVTHTDKDHVRGFDEVFHRGKPGNKTNGKVLVEEIVCTQYVLDLTNPSNEAKDLVNEIRRRKNLPANEKNIAGNRLKVVKSGDKIAVNSRLNGYVLSPSSTELDAANPKGDQDSSTNNTSIVIQWSYQDGDNSNVTKIILGGDAEREVWERLNNKENKSKLNWNLTSAHHHCSMTPFAKKDEDTGKYVDNDGAVNALNSPIGTNAYVVSSSRAVKKTKPNPPHYDARKKWISIVKKEENFFCTATHKDGKAAPVEFELNNKGIKKVDPGSDKKNTVKIAGCEGLTRPTKYG